MSKQITIPVPDGKRAEWINGVLTLVDEQKVDNRPVTERIKTFEDACNAYCKVCGHYPHTVPIHICRKNCDYFSDFIKYMKGK